MLGGIWLTIIWTTTTSNRTVAQVQETKPHLEKRYEMETTAHTRKIAEMASFGHANDEWAKRKCAARPSVNVDALWNETDSFKWFSHGLVPYFGCFPHVFIGYSISTHHTMSMDIGLATHRIQVAGKQSFVEAGRPDPLRMPIICHDRKNR